MTESVGHRVRGRLFVHVGYSKTGTTSIQHSFYRERDLLLASQGLLYPESCVAKPELGHHNICWEVAPEPLFNPANGKLADLVAEVHRLKPDNILISSEALVKLLVAYPECFRTAFLDELEHYALTIIIVVRRIDEHLESKFRHQFTAWMWDRPFKGSTDFRTYLDQFDVGKALAPIRCLLDSDYDVIYLPYGPGMVQRFAQLLELAGEATAKLTAHQSINITWMSNRALALIGQLVNRPDGEELRHVGNDRASFRHLLEGLGERSSGSRLLPAESARVLLARAAPLYAEVGHEFHRAVMGDGPPDDSEPGAIETQFNAAEIDRINTFSGEAVMATDSP